MEYEKWKFTKECSITACLLAINERLQSLWKHWSVYCAKIHKHEIVTGAFHSLVIVTICGWIIYPQCQSGVSVKYMQLECNNQHNCESLWSPIEWNGRRECIAISSVSVKGQWHRWLHGSTNEKLSIPQPLNESRIYWKCTVRHKENENKYLKSAAYPSIAQWTWGYQSL